MLINALTRFSPSRFGGLTDNQKNQLSKYTETYTPDDEVKRVQLQAELAVEDMNTLIDDLRKLVLDAPDCPATRARVSDYEWAMQYQLESAPILDILLKEQLSVLSMIENSDEEVRAQIRELKRQALFKDKLLDYRIRLQPKSSWYVMSTGLRNAIEDALVLSRNINPDSDIHLRGDQS